MSEKEKSDENKIRYEKIASYLIYAIICGLIFLAGFFIYRNYPGILNWAELHSVLITAIATILLGVATVVLVIVTMLLVKYNEKLWRAQNEPLVYVYKKCFMNESNKPYVGFYVKNGGKGPAIEVKLNVVSQEQKYYIEALSPGEKSTIFITPKSAFGGGFIGEATIGVVTIDIISYKDFNGFEYGSKKVTFEPDEPLGLGQVIELTGDY